MTAEREELVNELYETFVKPQKTIEESRYAAETNTVYSSVQKKQNSMSQNLNAATQNTPELVLEKEDFEEILYGKHHFAVVKESGVYLYGEIKIREVDKFIPTGRFAIKTISQIARSEDMPGIKEGYAVIGWD